MNTPGAGPYAGQGAGMGPGMGPNQLGPEGMIIEREGLPDVPQYFEAPKYNFKVQLVWREQPLSARLEAKRLAEEAAAAAAEEAAAAAGDENLAGDAAAADDATL